MQTSTPKPSGLQKSVGFKQPQLSEPLRCYYEKSSVMRDIITDKKLAKWFLQSVQNANRLCDWMNVDAQSHGEVNYQCETIFNALKILDKLTVLLYDEEPYMKLLRQAVSIEEKPVLEILLCILNGLNGASIPYRLSERKLAKKVGERLFSGSDFDLLWGGGYGGSKDQCDLDSLAKHKYSKETQFLTVLLDTLTENGYTEAMEVLKVLAQDHKGSIVSYRVEAAEGKVQIGYVRARLTLAIVATYFEENSSFNVIGKIVTERTFTGQQRERMIPFHKADETVVHDCEMLGEKTLKDNATMCETAEIADERRARFTETLYNFSRSLGVNVLKSGFGIDITKAYPKV